jgi:hypothetical protein
MGMSGQVRACEGKDTQVRRGGGSITSRMNAFNSASEGSKRRHIRGLVGGGGMLMGYVERRHA